MTYISNKPAVRLYYLALDKMNIGDDNVLTFPFTYDLRFLSTPRFLRRRHRWV